MNVNETSIIGATRITGSIEYKVIISDNQFSCPICKNGVVSTTIKNEFDNFTCDGCNAEFHFGFKSPVGMGH